MSGLIVPIDVLAYCVGTRDAHGSANSLAGATTDYRDQAPKGRRAFLGVNITRDLDQPPMWPLERGVHLHWAMPDALTRADTASGNMRFPALPNRWLVTRVVGDARSARHWIVRSDALSQLPPDGKPTPTVPVLDPAPAGVGQEPTRAFRFLGTSEPFTSEWAEPRAGAETLAAMAGSDLHAVTTGDIAFAAFYPNSRSVFGFLDDLTDLDAPAELMYVVTGWYDTPANDPLSGGLTVAQLEAELGWTLTTPSAAPVTYSLYSGLVQNISWDPDTQYLANPSEPIPGDVAIGSHPAEALAAYFRGISPHPEKTAYEELLTLYLTGLLPQVATPTAGQLADLEESLHELGFSGVDAGTIYTIMRGSDEVVGLPLPLADALNRLNTRQQAADAAAAQLWQGKWQLFSSWYRLFEVTKANQQAAFTAFSTQVQLQQAISDWAGFATGTAIDERIAVGRMLSAGQRLTPGPASRYYTATEPVVLLAGEAAAPSARYGGDGRYHPGGLLVCRSGSDVLQALTIAPATTLQASRYAALAPPAPDRLPHPEVGALVQEAVLLDTAVGAQESGVDRAALTAGLVAWLENGASQLYGHPVGVPPSAVAVNVWPDANPWMSLMLLWEADFHPLLATGGGTDYPPGYFTANYRLDPGNPRMIAYDLAADGISIDPAAISFDPDDPRSGTFRYTGSSVLSTAAADNLRARLAADPATRLDPTLKELSGLLAATSIALQNITGFNDQLLTREPSLQLAIGAATDAPLAFKQAASQVIDQIPALSQIPPLAPQFNGNYSGIRAGYMKLSLRVMDPFGRKRPVQVGNLYLADGMAVTTSSPAPGVVYLQPRVTQASRLLFRWLAADTTEYDEMNAHPATTPVCGWLLPDHLSKGLFVYSAQGDPLGSLTLRADESGIVWQATPGDQATIDVSLATVMAAQNPHLRELALALGASTPAWFRAFWQAADAAVTQIVPASPASQAGLAALAGRPLALVQASLRLERQGLAALDQAYSTMSDGTFTATDHEVGGVRFPVVLGQLRRLDDGLVGYFKQAAGGGYDTTTFFTQAATGTDPGVVVPSPGNLLLSPQAVPETAPAAPPAESKLLMLVDPRAAVHATTGILPTQSLSIPADQYADTLAGLELTFPAAPLLRAAGGLAVPIPAITGYDWSWITQERTGPRSAWVLDSGLQPATAGAVWQYSPQTLTEGWLRLNPQLLRFQLNSADGTPVVTAGASTTLRLLITNARGAPITFAPTAIAGELSPVQGSIFYIHFGSLVEEAAVGSIQPAAAGWRFEALSDPRYGRYWAATPDLAAVTLAPGEQLTMTLANVAIADRARAQSRVSFDYFNLTGIDDGVDIAILAIRQPAAPA